MWVARRRAQIGSGRSVACSIRRLSSSSSQADVSLLRIVDEVCKQIRLQEDAINLLCLSQGALVLTGKLSTELLLIFQDANWRWPRHVRGPAYISRTGLLQPRMLHGQPVTPAPELHSSTPSPIDLRGRQRRPCEPDGHVARSHFKPHGIARARSIDDHVLSRTANQARSDRHLRPQLPWTCAIELLSGADGSQHGLARRLYPDSAVYGDAE